MVQSVEGRVAAYSLVVHLRIRPGLRMMIPAIKHRQNLLFRFILTLGLLSYELVKGEFQVLGSPDPVLAVENKDAVLPCHVEPQVDMDNPVLEWTKLKQHSFKNQPEDLEYVHIYRDAHELLDLKLPSYLGRTSLLDKGLRRGNMSLRISNVTLADGGRYRCFIPTLNSLNQSTVVTLVVIAETPLLQKDTQTNETSTAPATGGSSRQSSIGCLIMCIVVAVQMLI